MQRRSLAVNGWIIVVCILLLSGGGCSWCPTGHGWLLQSGWSLEFKRIPFCTRTPVCVEECVIEAPKDRSCEPVCENSGENNGEVINEANPPIIKRENCSLFARMLGRGCRSSICAGCGRSSDRYPEARTKEAMEQQPVIARLHPVPTQPVFCPREETTQPASYDPALKQKVKDQATSTPAKKIQSRPKAPLPEEIPPPPVDSELEKSAATAPRQLDIPPEPQSWVFSPPVADTKKSEPLVEAQLQPGPSERTTKRR
jgi:hypothetical protein